MEYIVDIEKSVNKTKTFRVHANSQDEAMSKGLSLAAFEEEWYMGHGATTEGITFHVQYCGRDDE